MDNPGKQNLRDQFSDRQLEILRLMAEGLSNQEIATRLFLAVTTIKWYIRQINDQLDTHSRTQTIARAHQLKLMESAEAVLASPQELLKNPYKGLRAFQEMDAADFFGRESLTQRLLARLSEVGTINRFLAVVGPSGSGKSSVVKAGLIPALRRGALHGSQNWLMAEMMPGTHPLEEMEIALLRMATNPPTSLLLQLREDERGLLRAIRRVLPDDNSQLLLVIDQFEEVFTLAENPGETAHFLNSLFAAVSDPRSPLRVVITLRADFYDRPLFYTQFGQMVHKRTEVVLPLTPQELELAIDRPAKRLGVTLEAGLVTAIVAEAHQQPGGLPLLQYALTELFDHHQGNTLTIESYRAIGGTLGALTLRADTLYSELDDTEHEVTRQMFLRLVTLGEGSEDTRRRVLQTELLSLGNPEAMQEIMDAFGHHRLLTMDRDPLTHTATVELAHEAIIREWKRLHIWLDECRADVRQQRLLASAAAEWSNAKQDAGFLLTGSRLVQFEEWAGKTGVALTSEERAYLAASLAEHKRLTALEKERNKRELKLERRSRNVLRVLVIVLLLATLGAFGLTGVAQRNERDARSLQLAQAAQLALNEGNSDQAIQEAQAALQIGSNTLAQRVLDLAAYAPAPLTPLLFRDNEHFTPRALTTTKTNLVFAIVAHFGPDNPFGALLFKGMEDACAALKISCHLPSGFGGVEEMGTLWDEALALNPDAIGTTIIDVDTIRSRLDQAAERGIPVIVFNSARDQEFSLPSMMYIGGDEYSSGQSNARRVFAEARDDGATIHRGVCTMQAEGYTGLMARCAGVASIFNQEGVSLDQILISDESNETAASQIAAYFAQNPETNAIFMLGPGPAHSLNLYLRQAGVQQGQLYATTHDPSSEIFQMIRDGYLLQTIDQQPYLQGFQTILSLYLYREYGLRPSGFINTSSVVDRSNVNSVARLVELGYR